MGTVKRRKRKREGEGNGTAHNMRVGTNDVSFERTGAPGGPALLLLSTEQRLSVEFASAPRALVEARGALGGLQWLSGGWNLNAIFPLPKPRKL